jgi:hypothetical protein
LVATVSPFGALLVGEGDRWRIVPQLATLAAEVAGQEVCDGDWGEARRAARQAGVALDINQARQTYRRCVFSVDEPVATLIGSFRIGYDALDAIIPYADECLVAQGETDGLGLLRGVGVQPQTSSARCA